MTEKAIDLLERFRTSFGKDIDLTLRGPYHALLEKLGNPHTKLKNVIHVAGTNGKGSTCAFLRAALEASGYSVHVYSSPHLVTIHERIRVAGKLIEEDALYALLKRCEELSKPGTISFFEASTAAAFAAFAETPADVTILEVGLGGRLDATNVIDRPAATVIARLSFDHRDYLGDTMAAIAGEKAGIMKPGIPCFSAPQPSAEALVTLEAKAQEVGSPLSLGGRDWTVEIQTHPAPNEGFLFKSAKRTLSLPPPALLGQHQFWNAGLALATLEALSLPIPEEALREAMHTVEWKARLQPIKSGVLFDLLPSGWELWLDGGHNDSAGEVLGLQADLWDAEPSPKKLHLIYGMLANKDAQAFLAPLAPHVEAARALRIENEILSQTPEALVLELEKAGIKNGKKADNFREALLALVANAPAPGRILICGSLYLAGLFLAENKTGTAHI